MAYLKDPDRQFKAAPDVVADRRERWDGLHAMVKSHGGWVVSLQGAAEVTIEILPGSGLPDTLTNMGFILKPEPDGERITERYAKRLDGSFGPVNEGSTAKTIPVTHAGVVRVRRHGFVLP